MREKMEMLLKQRELTWDKEEWFVPLAPALDGLGPVEAAWQPPGGGNTIWETLNHLNYYNHRLLCRLTKTEFGPEKADNDATFGPKGDPEDGPGWEATRERTRRIVEGLRQALAGASDADYRETHASWVMHDAYHTGQIVLIRKQQGSWPAHRG